MKAVAWVLALAALSGTGARAQPKADDLAWIAGAWVQDQGGAVVRELWLRPEGGVMAGVGATVAAGHKPEIEFMKISADAQGRLVYTAILEGQPPTPFVLLPGTAGEAVFENKAHDFPQRVIYRRCGEDLCARIEGLVGGKLEGEDWHYRRAAP